MQIDVKEPETCWQSSVRFVSRIAQQLHWTGGWVSAQNTPTFGVLMDNGTNPGIFLLPHYHCFSSFFTLFSEGITHRSLQKSGVFSWFVSMSRCGSSAEQK